MGDTQETEAAPMRANVMQVIQADRDRLADHLNPDGSSEEPGDWVHSVRHGLADDYSLLHLLAAHRLAHTARPDAGDEVERFWLIIREPGMVPDRKGPFKIIDTAKVLREFMAANPNAFIDYLTVTPDGEPYVDHGPQVLQMSDGRSMSVGRKHNERVKAAALAAMDECSCGCKGDPFICIESDGTDRPPHIRQWPPLLLTPALRYILGMMCFQLAAPAHLFQKVGEFSGAEGMTLRKRAEDEQAFMLHKLVGFWFAHGEDWGPHASADLTRAKAAAADLSRTEVNNG